MSLFVSRVILLNTDMLAAADQAMHSPDAFTKYSMYTQAHREGGVSGASAPGPGGPKGARRAPSKKFKLV